jgi:hypothetical protein
MNIAWLSYMLIYICVGAINLFFVLGWHAIKNGEKVLPLAVALAVLLAVVAVISICM